MNHESLVRAVNGLEVAFATLPALRASAWLVAHQVPTWTWAGRLARSPLLGSTVVASGLLLAAQSLILVMDEQGPREGARFAINLLAAAAWQLDYRRRKQQALSL